MQEELDTKYTFERAVPSASSDNCLMEFQAHLKTAAELVHSALLCLERDELDTGTLADAEASERQTFRELSAARRFLCVMMVANAQASKHQDARCRFLPLSCTSTKSSRLRWPHRRSCLRFQTSTTFSWWTPRPSHPS